MEISEKVENRDWEGLDEGADIPYSLKLLYPLDELKFGNPSNASMENVNINTFLKSINIYIF